MPDAATIQAVRALAQEAAELLLRLQGNVEVEIKSDGSPVSEADLKANALILAGLEKITPHMPILAEEKSAEENAAVLSGPGHFWSVDPLDVTGNYLQGGDGFSVNIALLQDWVPVFGLLIFPGKGECYFTDAEGRAFLEMRDGTSQPLAVRPFAPQSGTTSPRDILSIALRERGNEDALQLSQRAIRTLVTTGQRRACLVARGEALMSSEAAGFRLWDSAPTFAILQAAGGECRQNDGQVLSFKDRLALPEYTVGHASLLDRILPAA